MRYSMTKYKYHPLVDSDTDGREKVPMFFSTDEKAVAKSHELYLAEIVLHYYRLHARTAHSKATYSRYDIHCPVCGHVMDAISSHINEHTREATRNNDRLSMTTSTMRPVVCHANPPTDGTFPSEQIQSQHDSTGRAGIGCPTEDRIRDQKVAGSNPVTSTTICLKTTVFRLFCCLILLNFLSKIPRFLTKSGFRRTSPLPAEIGRQLIKAD